MSFFKRLVLEAVLLPRNLALALLIAYRKLISPLYGDVCRYYPSCSAYALGSVQGLGLVRGVPVSAWRILRCNPWSAGGIDDHAAAPNWATVSRLGFVRPRTEKKR